MILPILAFLVISLASARDFLRHIGDKGILEYFITFVTSGAMGLVAVAIALIPAFGIGVVLEKEWSNPVTEELVSLRNDDGVSGHAFLGSGQIKSTQYYFYYTQAGNGGYHPGSVVADENVTVYEQERKDGLLKSYTLNFAEDFYWLFGLTIPVERYEFFIPTGSLVKDYILQ